MDIENQNLVLIKNDILKEISIIRFLIIIILLYNGSIFYISIYNIDFKNQLFAILTSIIIGLIIILYCRFKY